MEIKHIEKESLSGAQLNLDALFKIAPSCFTEAKKEDGSVRKVVDFNKLRLLLGDNTIEDVPEVYDFTWVGKRAALREAAAPIRKTLRPCPEESVNWDTTQNLYIEGDNLEVLKLLQNSYMGKVKMIYIDPPYNTGNDFVYHDNFAQSADEYDETNRDEEGNRYRRNTDSNGRFHSDWCSMIYARLMVARTLLKDDGVIFISINDHEVDNLIKIANEVFGESNQLAYFCWRTDGNFDNQARIKTCHEYILLYAKDEELVGLPDAIDPNIPSTSKIFKDEIRNTIIKNGIKNPIEDVTIPIGFPCDVEECTISKKSVIWPQYDNDINIASFKTQNEVIAKTGWASRAQLLEFINNKYAPVKDSKGQETVFVMTKTGAIESIKKRGNTSHVISLLNNMGGTQKATSDMGELGNYFDYPKPVSLMTYLCKMYTQSEDIILDFFSGSGTTAHASMFLNSSIGGHRKFIMVQWPEETPSDSEAAKAGYKNICEIGKERIRRAGKKIKSDSPLTTQDLDIGFRVFKCDESNYKDVAFSPKDYSQEELDMFVDNIKDDRSDLDLLFDCMLRWGVELSMPMKKTTADGCTIHNVDDGNLVACFDGVVTEKVIDAIAAMSPVRVVFRDSSFTEAAAKMNLFELFKQKCGWSESEVKNNVRVI